MRARVMAEGKPISDSEATLMVMQDALAGELGMQLEPRKAAVDVLAIDHAEKSPVEN